MEVAEGAEGGEVVKGAEGAIGADWVEEAIGCEGAMGAEGAEEAEGAAIYILLDGYDTMGIDYMALWGFGEKSGVDG